MKLGKIIAEGIQPEILALFLKDKIDEASDLISQKYHFKNSRLFNLFSKNKKNESGEFCYILIRAWIN
ncbi:MAG: hypothetical protein AAGI07_09210, partial [Bacteroidota bacterium]